MVDESKALVSFEEWFKCSDCNLPPNPPDIFWRIIVAKEDTCKEYLLVCKQCAVKRGLIW